MMIEMLDLTLNLLDFLCNHTNRIFIKMKCGVVQKNFDFFSFVRRNRHIYNTIVKYKKTKNIFFIFLLSQNYYKHGRLCEQIACIIIMI